MNTEIIVETLASLVNDVYQSADATGCDGDLIVVSQSALLALVHRARELKEAGEGDTVQTSSSQKSFQESLEMVESISNLSIWDYDNNEGDPYEECEEPSEGYLDSHCCLMDLIESARSILKGEKS
jgi:hypothetical protein